MPPEKPQPSFHVSPEQAKRFMLLATGMGEKFGSIADALHHLGYVQLDPLNVCGRIQDLVLRHRVQRYAPGDLLRYVHGQLGPRGGFEHYLPGYGILMAWPLEAYRFIAAYLKQSPASGTRRVFTAAERGLADRLLREIETRGPLRSDEIEHDERGITVWGTPGRVAKIVLEKLFACGELAIARRQDFRRVYDLSARVFGGVDTGSPPTAEEVAIWRAMVVMKQRRLVRLRKSDRALLGENVVDVDVDGCGMVQCLRSDVRLWDAAADAGAVEQDAVRLLAPLDPVIYDRKLTQRLWDFDFTWEVYTPPSLRRRGYYSLPALRGTDLVGDVEPRVDWKRRRLTVLSRRIRRGVSTRAAVEELASFLGVRPPR
jgi:uncharacterized protein